MTKEELENSIDDLEALIEDRNLELGDLTEDLVYHEGMVEQCEAEIDTLSDEIAELQDELQEKLERLEQYED